MQVEFEALDSGCCGMAGAFGFEKGDHYDVSIKCGERVLLPRARELADGEILITDGFSCHEQVLQQTGKRALHLAQVLEIALKSGLRESDEQGGETKNDGPTEDEHVKRDGHGRIRWVAPVVGAAAAAVVTAVRLTRSQRLRR